MILTGGDRIAETENETARLKADDEGSAEKLDLIPTRCSERCASILKFDSARDPEKERGIKSFALRVLNLRIQSRSKKLFRPRCGMYFITAVGNAKVPRVSQS